MASRNHRQRFVRRLKLLAIAGLGLTVFLAADSNRDDKDATSKDSHTEEADPESVSEDLHVTLERSKPSPDLKRGKKLFGARCATCHGADGRGAGPAARHIVPPPADLTRGLFKVRSTAFDKVATDVDLFRTLTQGIPGTAMIAWRGISVNERWQLVYYLQSLVPDYAKRRGQAVAIPPVAPATAVMIERGRAVYKTLQCATCHGVEGRGNGPSSHTLKDVAGNEIFPIDFSRSRKFKGGSQPQDIYRTLHTGFAGTPMKSFAGMMTEKDTWALVHYIRSLRVDAPKPAVVAQSDAVAPADDSKEFERLQQTIDDLQKQIDALSKAKPEKPTPPPQPDPAEAERKRKEAKARKKAEAAKRKAALRTKARAFYRTRCAACHGSRGRGDGPASGGLNPKPRDFSDPSWQSSVTSSHIEKIILLGGPAVGKHPTMPPSPDLKSQKQLLKQLRRLVRSFKRK